MEREGFELTHVVLDDLSDIESQYGIPKSLQDCHTAIVGGYFIEGHVPVEAVRRLLKEKPDIRGLSLPGMPSGSPGMPGRKTGPFIVLQLNKDGSVQEFGSY